MSQYITSNHNGGVYLSSAFVQQQIIAFIKAGILIIKPGVIAFKES